MLNPFKLVGAYCFMNFMLFENEAILIFNIYNPERKEAILMLPFISAEVNAAINLPVLSRISNSAEIASDPVI